MPKAGMAMEEGTVVEWFKQEGDVVEAGEPLLEIETDKVNMEIESTDSGVLLKILKGAGEVIPVTQIIAYIGEPGEEIENVPPNAFARVNNSGQEESLAEADLKSKTRENLGMVGDRVAATPLARTLAAQKGIDLITLRGTGSHGEIKVRDVEKLIRSVTATPLAKRIAAEQQLDLSTIQGSGPGGKIVKDDILARIAGSAKTERATPKVEKATRKQLQGMRKVIAEKMLQSYLQAPQVTLDAKADVTELVALRKQINQKLDRKISFNDFILKAVALALVEAPNINVSIEGDEIVYKTGVNIGIAVALEDGLIVPVIKDADTLSLKQIAKTAKALTAKARERKLLPDEYSGGTFTVSNLGMYDIVSFTPIINPPESAILGVCAIQDELKLVGDKIENKNVMGLSLTFDHRVIDGAQGAIFLQQIKLLLENPIEIVVS
jgi:pyruvate dehydrogenase E2 component (dihydrolipoamide acetyltransferase)